MATREIMHYEWKGREGTVTVFNVSASVGDPGSSVNMEGDVMLIQAMFHFIVRGHDPSTIGLPPGSALPAVSGTFDGATSSAIWAYQRQHAGKIVRIDGVIEPAIYYQTKFKVVSVLPTITWLHIECAIQHDYTSAIPRLFPQLLPWIADYTTRDSRGWGDFPVRPRNRSEA